MLQSRLLSLFLCWQYAASIPVSSSVYSREADHSLRLQIVPATWVQADLLCQQEGGILASPTTSAIADAMRTAIAEKKLSSNGVFIGVTQLLSKGDYKSVDGAPVADIPLEWAAGEPNNVDNAQHCLALTGAGALADVSCSSALPYFCRKQSVNNSNASGEGIPSPQMPPCNGKSDYEWEPRTGSCYKFHPAAEAWLPALKTCHAEGGHLAIINNQTESTVLKEMYDRNKEEIAGAYDPKYSIIGFNKWAHNEWVTIHGETLTEAGFAEWSQNEPNNYGGAEDCGTIFWNGLLNDAPCEHKYPYICEIAPLI